jgi:uncharacterized DUF497 family protein
MILGPVSNITPQALWVISPEAVWVKKNACTLYQTKLHCSYEYFAFRLGSQKSGCQSKKHGVSFDEARTVFFDERAKLIDDPDHSESEDRFVLLGLSGTLRVILVCHCYREEGNVIRIISARKASPHEAKQYD